MFPAESGDSIFNPRDFVDASWKFVKMYYVIGTIGENFTDSYVNTYLLGVVYVCKIYLKLARPKRHRQCK
jgi:hypothetical protein